MHVDVDVDDMHACGCACRVCMWMMCMHVDVHVDDVHACGVCM
jgi:hypothetical protein